MAVSERYDAIERVEILGIPVGAIDMASAVERILSWGERHESRYVCACDVHSIMRSVRDEKHKWALRHADLVTADGQPVVWTARMRGHSHISRVCGPDLLNHVCAASEPVGLKHYFYGGAEGVAATVADELKKSFPKLAVVGAECPPFRPLSPQEEEDLRARVARSGADIMWIGLGCPKQEQWMYDHVAQIPGVVLIGVGAAFDFQSKRIVRAPVWMQSAGLEWLHRLMSEPGRLWRRYLVLAPQFVIASLAETIRLRLWP
ncbi:MAG: WecB/TagA/CpsF family glycosyltransferase [Hyphomicrobium sp.]